jgi:hypothetical protein
VTADTASPVYANSARPAESSLNPSVIPGEKQPDAEQQYWRKMVDNSAPDLTGAPSGVHVPAGLPGATDGPTPGAGQPEHTAAPEPAFPTASAPVDPAAGPVRTAAAHDIKLQVGVEGEQRVEVRVTERGGDVYVAVRTPDTRLAGELRQDLPALASRLEQSGFHATTWTPPAADRQHLADPRPGALPQDTPGQGRQNGREPQRDPQEQKRKDPENPDNPSQPQEQGKDFAWLLSSIR